MFKLSIDEEFIILITDNFKLQKIFISNDENSLTFLREMNHEPGVTGWISFNKDSSYFICGGNKTSDLIIYKSSNLEILY